MKKILYEKSVSYRNPPQNLETKELNLFEHEFKRNKIKLYLFEKTSMQSTQSFFNS